MVRFQCDTCGKLKEREDGWILGFAAENIGVTSARREISIAATWERPRAVEPLAVHFCSDKCRNGYMARLFGDVGAGEGNAMTTKRRVKRVVPGSVVETVVTEKNRPAVTRRRRRTA